MDKNFPNYLGSGGRVFFRVEHLGRGLLDILAALGGVLGGAEHGLLTHAQQTRTLSLTAHACAADENIIANCSGSQDLGQS